MKAGDLVKNLNSESGEHGLFVGMRTFKHSTDRSKDYTCAEVYWSERNKVSAIQADLIEVINESR